VLAGYTHASSLSPSLPLSLSPSLPLSLHAHVRPCPSHKPSHHLSIDFLNFVIKPALQAAMEALNNLALHRLVTDETEKWIEDRLRHLDGAACCARPRAEGMQREGEQGEKGWMGGAPGAPAG
jgi:hypothetical protein